MDKRPRHGSFNRPIPIHLGDFYLVGVGTMTEATRLALADRIEALFDTSGLTTSYGRMVHMSREELEVIQSALRAIPQEPVVWEFRRKTANGFCSDWLTTNREFYDEVIAEHARGHCLNYEVRALTPIQSSDGRTDEAKARESVAAVADDESHKRDIGARRPHGSPSSNDHESSDQAGVGSERSSPSEPIAQGQREAIARIIEPAGFDPDNLAFEPFWIDQWKRRALAKTDAILATLPQPPVGACREALDLGDIVKMNERSPYFDDWRNAGELKVVSIRVDPNGKRWVSVIEGSPRHRGNGVYDSETTDIDADYLSKVALAPSAQEGETLETLIREYARDLRRNSSGGDDYPWEWAKATADYLEVLIERASPHSRPMRGGDQ